LENLGSLLCRGQARRGSIGCTAPRGISGVSDEPAMGHLDVLRRFLDANQLIPSRTQASDHFGGSHRQASKEHGSSSGKRWRMSPVRMDARCWPVLERYGSTGLGAACFLQVLQRGAEDLHYPAYGGSDCDQLRRLGMGIRNGGNSSKPMSLSCACTLRSRPEPTQSAYRSR
jgi:hypothetical protein